MRKYIIMLLMLFVMSSFAKDIQIVNNFETLKKFDTKKTNIRRRRRKLKKSGKKSSVKLSYFLKSFLVPGWTEYELGKKNESYFFWVTEAALIGTAFGFKIYSEDKKDDYMSFAKIHAGVNTANKRDKFWIDISNYDDTSSYNRRKYRDRAFGDVYHDEGRQWQWDSSKNRKRFDDMRISSDNADTMFYYSVGGIIINHLLSAVNASFSAVKITAGNELDKDGKVKTKLKASFDL